MDSSSFDISAVTTSTFKRPPKRLLFDRRYGWVFDEWKDPSEEALTGGRGMFSIVPLAKGLLKMASNSINTAASFSVKVFEKPDLLSPQTIQANLNDHLDKYVDLIKNPKVNLFAFKENFLDQTSCSAHSQKGGKES